MERVVRFGGTVLSIRQARSAARGVEIMLRMYLLSVWFNLSDEGVEDAIYDSYAFRQFLGIDFWAHEQAPDATTLCKFRKMLTEQGVTEQLFESIKALLEENGQIMHGGSIVDATIIEAPSSTKNAENRRDPEMHQVKKATSGILVSGSISA